MKNWIDQLTATLGPDKVLASGDILLERRHDYWLGSLIPEYLGDNIDSPAAVVQPTATEDVQQIVRIASENGVPVIPYGLGSGVVGGVVAQSNAILLDMGKMNQILEIDTTNMIATFEAGKRGIEAEEAVAAEGFTIGHWPQSIELSTVGGWVATRASGQYSTAYGNIEDVIYSMEVVLPDGSVATLGKAPRAAAGPDLRHLFLGSEGVMGIITKVSFLLRTAAPAREYSVFKASTMAMGFEAQRQILQAGWRPPVVRQYDAPESERHFGSNAELGEVILLMVHEGDPDILKVEKSKIAKIATEAGLQAQSDEIGAQWMEKRNTVPSAAELLRGGIVADTIEVSATWSKIDDVYQTAVSRLSEIPNIIVGSAHSSHAYRSGINLYFTFAINVEDKSEMLLLYKRAWAAVMDCTMTAGGGISHHHGIGRVRKDFLESDLGASGISILRSIKQAIDPSGTMNPGVLLPDE